jgi:hypothetical protein
VGGAGKNTWFLWGKKERKKKKEITVSEQMNNLSAAPS